MSSCSVYGNNKNLINEKSKPKPISLYSKLCLKYEKYLKKNKKINLPINASMNLSKLKKLIS